MKKTFLLPTILILSIALIWLSKANTINACFDCSCECPSCPRPTRPPHCPTPTVQTSPTPTEKVTPTLPPEATPTPTLPLVATPTPTSQPSGGGQGGPGGGSNTTAGQYSCNDPAPTAPHLKSASKLGGGKVALVWGSVSPVSYYGVSYGPASKNYLYGQTDIGNTTSYTVEGLTVGQNYCFVVNAVNGCASSPASNEVCTGEVLGAATGQVLGLSATSGDNKLTEVSLYFIGLVCLISGLCLRRLKTV